MFTICLARIFTGKEPPANPNDIWKAYAPRGTPNSFPPFI